MKVFVYGSLLRGFMNHHVLARAHFIRETVTREEFTLYDLGGFPAITVGSSPVSGELYKVDAVTLAALDRLESHPRFYRRTPIVLADGSRAETYVLPPERVGHRPVISSGSWREHQKDRAPCLDDS